ncbi:MAG TPA: YncE family protein [Polyangiaceae bacterium]|nr:YncE family protein [Polyangiaceae bacterium]
MIHFEKGHSVRPAPGQKRLLGASALLVLALASLGGCSSNNDDPRAFPLKEEEAGAGGGGGAGSDAGPKQKLVVTADWLNGSLSVLDYEKLVGDAATRDDALVRTIDLSTYLPGPLEVDVTPDGKTAVVAVGPGFFVGTVGGLIGATNVDPGGTFLLVDLATGTVTKEIKPPAGPMGLAVSPDGKRAFTADHGNNEGKTLSVFDLVSQTLEASIEVGLGAEEVSLSPDGTMGVINTDSDGAIHFFDPKASPVVLSAPLVIGNDPDLAAFVPAEKKLVIAQSLPKASYSVVDLTDPNAPSILENPALPGIPYGTNLIPGTSHVLVTSGITECSLREIDVSVAPSAVTRTITMPCAKASLPLSTAIDADGKHAFVGAPGENALMVVDLEAGTTKAIPWLSKAGPTRVAIVP